MQDKRLEFDAVTCSKTQFVLIDVWTLNYSIQFNDHLQVTFVRHAASDWSRYPQLADLDLPSDGFENCSISWFGKPCFLYLMVMYWVISWGPAFWSAKPRYTGNWRLLQRLHRLWISSPASWFRCYGSKLDTQEIGNSKKMHRIYGVSTVPTVPWRSHSHVSHVKRRCSVFPPWWTWVWDPILADLSHRKTGRMGPGRMGCKRWGGYGDGHR